MKLDIVAKNFGITTDNDNNSIVPLQGEGGSSQKVIKDSNLIPFNNLITSACNKGDFGYSLTSGGSLQLNKDKSEAGLGYWEVQPSGLAYRTTFKWLMTEKHDRSPNTSGDTYFTCKNDSGIWGLQRSGGTDVGDGITVNSQWYLRKPDDSIVELPVSYLSFGLSSNVGSSTYPFLAGNIIEGNKTTICVWDLDAIDKSLPEPFLKYTIPSSAVGEIASCTMYTHQTETVTTRWLAVGIDDMDCNRSYVLIWKWDNDSESFLFEQEIKMWGMISPTGYISGEPKPDLDQFAPSSLVRLGNGQYQLDLYDGGDSQVIWRLLAGYRLTDTVEKVVLTTTSNPSHMNRTNINVNDTSQPEYPQSNLFKYFYFNFVEDRKVYWDYGMGWMKTYLRNNILPESGTIAAFGFGNDTWIGITIDSLMVTSNTTPPTNWVREPVELYGINPTRIYYFDNRWFILTQTGSILVSNNAPTFRSITNGPRASTTDAAGIMTAQSSTPFNVGMVLTDEAINNRLVLYRDFRLNYQVSNIPSINGVANNTNIFVAVGNDGRIWRTVDFQNWNEMNSRTNLNLNSIEYFRNLFVAVGDNGTVVTSSNGEVWKISNIPASGKLVQVARTYRNSSTTGKIIARSEDGRLWSSEDGVSWTIRTPTSATHQFIYPIQMRWKSDANLYTIAKNKTTGIIERASSSNNGDSWSYSAFSGNYQPTENVRVLSNFHTSATDTTQNNVMVFDLDDNGWFTFDWNTNASLTSNRRYVGLNRDTSPEMLYSYWDMGSPQEIMLNYFLVGDTSSSVLYYPNGFSALQNGKQFSYQQIERYSFEIVSSIVYNNNFYFFGRNGEFTITSVTNGYIFSPSPDPDGQFSCLTGLQGQTNDLSRIFYQYIADPNVGTSIRYIRQVSNNNKSLSSNYTVPSNQRYDYLRAWETGIANRRVALGAFQNSEPVYRIEQRSTVDGVIVDIIPAGTVAVGDKLVTVVTAGVFTDIFSTTTGTWVPEAALGDNVEETWVLGLVSYLGPVNVNGGLYINEGNNETLTRKAFATTDKQINKVAALDLTWDTTISKTTGLVIGEHNEVDGTTSQLAMWWDGDVWQEINIVLGSYEQYTDCLIKRGSDSKSVILTSEGIYYSTNFLDWSKAAVPIAKYTNLNFYNNIWVALSGGTPIYSEDGVSWTLTTTERIFNEIAYIQGWNFFGDEADTEPGSSFNFEKIDIDAFGGNAIYGMDVNPEGIAILVGANGIAVKGLVDGYHYWSLVSTQYTGWIGDVFYTNPNSTPTHANWTPQWWAAAGTQLLFSNDNGDTWTIWDKPTGTKPGDSTVTAPAWWSTALWRLCFYNRARNEQYFCATQGPIIKRTWDNSAGTWTVWPDAIGPKKDDNVITSLNPNGSTVMAFGQQDATYAWAIFDHPDACMYWNMTNDSFTTSAATVFRQKLRNRYASAAYVPTVKNTNGSNDGPTSATILASTYGGIIIYWQSSWTDVVQSSLSTNINTMGTVMAIGLHTYGVRPNEKNDTYQFIDRYESLKLKPDYSFEKGKLNETNYFIGGTNNGSSSIIAEQSFTYQLLTDPNDGTEILKGLVYGLSTVGHSTLNSLVTSFGEYSDRVVINTVDYKDIFWSIDNYAYRIEKTDDASKLKVDKIADFSFRLNVLDDKNLFIEDRNTGTLSLYQSFIDWINELVIEIPSRQVVIVTGQPNDAFNAIAAFNLDLTDPSRSTSFLLPATRLAINVATGDRQAFVRETLSQRNSILRPFMRQDYAKLDFYFTVESQQSAIMYRTTQVSTQTAGDRLFNVYGRPTIETKLNNTVYYINTSTTMVPMGIGAELTAINYVQPNILLTKNRRTQLYITDNNLILSFFPVNYISFGQVMFSLYGGLRFFDGQGIYSVLNTSNGITNQFITLALGMRFVGNSSAYGWFYSEWEKALYAFGGSNTLEKWANLSSLDPILDGFYSSHDQLLWLQTNTKLLIMRGRDVISTFDIEPNGILISNHNGVSIQYDDHYVCYAPYKKDDLPVSAYLETEYVGATPSANISFAAFQLVFHNVGPATIKTRVSYIENEKVYNNEETITIKSTDPVKVDIPINVNQAAAGAKLILTSNDLICIECISVIGQERGVPYRGSDRGA